MLTAGFHNQRPHALFVGSLVRTNKRVTLSSRALNAYVGVLTLAGKQPSPSGPLASAAVAPVPSLSSLSLSSSSLSSSPPLRPAQFADVLSDMVATNVGWRFGALAQHVASTQVSATVVTELYKAVASAKAVDVDAALSSAAGAQQAQLRSLHKLWAQTRRLPAAKAGLFQVCV